MESDKQSKIIINNSNGDFWDDILDNNKELIEKDYDEIERMKEKLKTLQIEKIQSTLQNETNTNITNTNITNTNITNTNITNKIDNKKQNKSIKKQKPKLNSNNKDDKYYDDYDDYDDYYDDDDVLYDNFDDEAYN
jgi:hypothetical protein